MGTPNPTVPSIPGLLSQLIFYGNTTGIKVNTLSGPIGTSTYTFPSGYIDITQGLNITSGVNNSVTIPANIFPNQTPINVYVNPDGSLITEIITDVTDLKNKVITTGNSIVRAKPGVLPIPIPPTRKLRATSSNNTVIIVIIIIIIILLLLFWYYSMNKKKNIY